MGCNSQLLGTTIENALTLTVNSTSVTATFLVLSGGWNQGNLVIGHRPGDPAVQVELAAYRMDGFIVVDGPLATVDTRGCQTGPISGSGVALRSTYTTSFTTPSFGFYSVPIFPPFPDNSYVVVASQTSNTVPTTVAVTTKTPSSFTFRDGNGGNTFDFVVYHS